ncbi:DUF6702 family protein [Cognaticolwellia mytili]|uniref:DUF6702 family protein n=1 Tax=Cognaticolwellia mytili TaxID=1888913 RepID=UPI000A172F71|nr:DUF6702 family protein [Cognaticolwellia mytili]
MFISLAKRFFVLLLCGLAANAAAHRYFFSITELSLNKNNQSIEIIHQITAHDIDNAIAEINQIHFSVAHPDYETIIRQYIENNFQLDYQGKTLVLNWIGLEVIKGNIFIYQEAKFHHSLLGLKITNKLLTDHYPKQINTVNFHDKAIKGSLTFKRSVTINEIENNN